MKLISLLLLLWPVGCSTQPQGVTVPEPYQGVSPPTANFLTDPPNIRAGQKLYQHHCATCHGETSRGDGPAGQTQSLKMASQRSQAVASRLRL